MSAGMFWFFYNVAFTVAYLLLLPRFILRMWRRGGYRRDFLQRFALYREPVLSRLREGGRVWVHAVSVGEVNVAVRLMEEMRRERPGTRFVLSTTTSTGHAIAESKLEDDDVLVYFPVDFPVVVRRALSMVRPEALILTECELWPNMIRTATGRGIPVILVNGRISDGSYRGYCKVRAIARRVTAELALALVQSPADRDRLLDLGAPAHRVHVVGSTKYDAATPGPEAVEKARAVLKSVGVEVSTPVLMGGSTWPGEETLLLQAYSRLREETSGLRLVLAPRHVERADEVEAEISAAGMACVRRSVLPGQAPTPDVSSILLVDTTGELMAFYACATVVFVGKSLTSRGGQNPIEPALLGKPTVVGPYMENFPVVMEEFLEAKALVQVADAEQLEDALRSLLSERAVRDMYGERALSLVQRRSGVVHQTVLGIGEVLGEGR